MTHKEKRQLKREWRKACKMRPWDAFAILLRLRSLAVEAGIVIPLAAAEGYFIVVEGADP